MLAYFSLIKMNFLAGLQYRGWPFMIIHVFCVVISDPIGTILLFSRFGSLGQWRMEQILFCYSLAITSFGLAETLMRGFDYFAAHTVRLGQMDRFLLRPRPLFWQVAGSVFHLHRMARLVTGLAAIGWTLSRMHVILSFGKLLVITSVIVSGFVMYTGLFVFFAGCAIYSVKGIELFNILTFAGMQTTRIPVQYMPVSLKLLFTFIVPLTVIVIYPASWICGWGAPLWQALLPIPAAAAFFAASMFFWCIAVRRYRSTGS